MKTENYAFKPLFHILILQETSNKIYFCTYPHIFSKKLGNEWLFNFFSKQLELLRYYRSDLAMRVDNFQKTMALICESKSAVSSGYVRIYSRNVKVETFPVLCSYIRQVKFIHIYQNSGFKTIAVLSNN